MRLTLAAIASLCAAAACDSSSSVAGAGGAGGSGATEGGGGEVPQGGEDSWVVPTGSGGCDTVLYNPPNAKGKHVPNCTPIEYQTNPPSSGTHYSNWADFKTYDEPIAEGFFVHAMEHGAVVLLYNCPSGCADDVAAMKQLVAGLTADEKCMSGSTTRTIIVPDPKLDVPFAAASWGRMLKAQCFDEELVGQFIEDHYGNGTEDTCASGIDPLDPFRSIPPRCGE
jgi:uncharacterized protein DUF3105